MTVWYFLLEGKGEHHPEAGTPFGFFVHCVVSAREKEDALRRIEEFLGEDDLEIEDMQYAGALDGFEWDDPELEERIRALAASAAASPGEVFSSDFFSWSTEDDE